MRTLKYPLILFFFLIFTFAAGAIRAEAATLTVSPTSGTFSVGSTFNVSVFLDTEGEAINVIDIGLRFPADKFQLISPSTGQSIIGVWTSPPKFNNQSGEISLQGGVPGGINVSRGLVTTLTFRVKQVGTASLRFEDRSRVLLNDGKGTDALRDTQNGVYNFILPPPAGPIVASETHSDQSAWYANPNVIFRWLTDPDVQGYSYDLSDGPVDIPDDVSEGIKTGATYRNLFDGVHYFHIKALRDGVWGGVTHFAVSIDTSPPAEFSIDISPGKRTVRRTPIISWETTDKYSGFDHYEVKLISLSSPTPLRASAEKSPNQPFFVETDSPYNPTLELGTYEVIVRAYDKAGNYREEKEKLKIVQSVFEVIAGQGIRISSRITIPWGWLVVVGVLLVVVLGFSGWQVWRWHRMAEKKISTGALNDPVIKARLAELKKRRIRLDKSLAIFILLIMASGWSPFVRAEEANLSPPLITLVSENITNEELFYIGGKSEIPGGEVVIYLQNTQTDETFNLNASVDKMGTWFYSHSQFLPTGQYLLWAQNKTGEELSAPTPQIKMNVAQAAIQFGVSRLSYETLYLVFSLILLALVLGLMAFIGFHAYHGRKKRLRFRKEMQEAEEAIRRGFSILRRDIEAELAVINQAKLNKKLVKAESIREEGLLKELDWIEKEIGKEILDVERFG